MEWTTCTTANNKHVLQQEWVHLCA